MPRLLVVALLVSVVPHLAITPATAAGQTPAAPTAPVHWPSFRGLDAAGVADGQALPASWDATTGAGVRFKVSIPGLAHSSPIVWGDRVFVTSAISSKEDADFVPGLYGHGFAFDDDSVHRWMVYALEKQTGKVLWERLAHEGSPRSVRHTKATQANSTPVTDGEVVVAFFGSEGLYAYTWEGELKWKKDLGVLNAGAYNVPALEWGTASSPVLHDGKVIVQCDVQGESFVLAASLATGETVWRTVRDELPSWGTPTIYPGPQGDELVTNGSNLIRGYDPETGEELWRLDGSSQITAPTPIFDEGLVFVASGRRPEKPIFAIRGGSRGDLSLADGETSSSAIAWSMTGRGPYMPTPLAYRGQLYVLNNDGVFASYALATGEEIYRERIEHGGSGFSASPVAADGKIYLPSEDGDIFAVKAGPSFEIVAKNPMGEVQMATPALSEGTMYVRAKHHLFAVSAAAGPAPEAAQEESSP